MTSSKLRFLGSFSALALAASLHGCAIDLDGDWSDGELGRTRWQLDDGLCPGFGGCAFDVPLAVGASPNVHVEGVDGTSLFVASAGSIDARDYRVLSAEDPDPFFRISATRAGTGTLSLRDADGTEIDRMTVHVREATALECGAMSSDATVLWNAPELVPATHIVLPIPAVDPETGDRQRHAFQLVCRARDAAGPLLSVDAIHWEVLEGSDVLELRGDGFWFGGEVTGARIRYETLAPGHARIRAQIGEVTAELDVTVE